MNLLLVLTKNLLSESKLLNVNFEILYKYNLV